MKYFKLFFSIIFILNLFTIFIFSSQPASAAIYTCKTPAGACVGTYDTDDSNPSVASLASTCISACGSWATCVLYNSSTGCVDQTRTAATSDMPNLQIPDLNIKFSPKVCEVENGKTVCSIAWIGEYVAGIYKYAIGIVGILAAVVLMIGGVIWIVAGGSATMIGEAKAWIGASLTGLVIALCSYLILFQINPALTVFGPLGITQVEKISIPTTENCQWVSVPSGQYCKDVKGSGWVNSDSNKCTTTKPEGLAYECCCQTGGAWAYQTNIEAQLSDASSELTSLLNCLKTNFPSNFTGTINSISDEHCTGNISACKNPSWPTCTASGQTNCHWHATNSCHYGTGTNYKSFAVDISTNNNATATITAAKDACSSQVNYFTNEGNHIHISATGCASN